MSWKWFQIHSRSFVISFICLNLLAVTRSHLPLGTLEALRLPIYKIHPTLERTFTYAEWALGYYAYIVGLDNRWGMFSYFHKDDWWFTFTGLYGNEERALPLPLQSPRTFWQKNFADFKEVKFHLNIYGQKQFQIAYAKFLCRKFTPIREVRIKRSFQAILPPEVALRLGYHMSPEVRTQEVERVPCRS